METTKNIVVVKAGTNVLTRENAVAGRPNRMDLNVMRDLAADISRAMAETRRSVILVSSGAVGFGNEDKDLKARFADRDMVAVKQALAAYGQPDLIRHWKDAFDQAETSRDVAQFLITHSNLNDERERADMLATLNLILELGDVPVFNENDTVANREIRVGDNDQLAASLADATRAKTLILLTDVGGVYDKNPKSEGARLITDISTADIAAIDTSAAGSGGNGTGGMASKLGAAGSFVVNGGDAWIANGREPNVVSRILGGEHVGTRIRA